MSHTMAFIHGESIDAANSYENIDPATSASLGSVASCGRSEVGLAVASARQANSAWRRTAPALRAELLTKLADLIARDADELARLETEDSGKPISQALNDAKVCARYFRFYGHAIDSFYG